MKSHRTNINSKFKLGEFVRPHVLIPHPVRGEPRGYLEAYDLCIVADIKPRIRLKGKMLIRVTKIATLEDYGWQYERWFHHAPEGK